MYGTEWQEARRAFDEKRDEKDTGVIKALQDAAEDRLAIALHYKIPYERPGHFGGGGGEGLSKHKERTVIAKGRKSDFQTLEDTFA